MLRWLYIQLIWLHPAPFRWRFGDDMLDDFDRAPLRYKPQFVADAVASLVRQWLLRPEFRRPEAAIETPLQGTGGPLLQTIDDYRPSPAALFHGGILALLSIVTAVVLMGQGGGAGPLFIGVHSSAYGLFPIDRNSVAPSHLNTSVEPGSDPSQLWLKAVKRYFVSMPMLRALDTDRDFRLSAREIGNAPAALHNLDTSNAGKLTAEQCGLRINPNSVSPATLAQLRRQFMSYHPVLAALDADHDGEISSGEMDHAATALKKLDRNRDGDLSDGELLPFDIAIRAGYR